MAHLARVGIFGGTFDPPHRGHTAIALQALEELELDSIWWIPAGTPPHKLEAEISPVEHRFAMVRITLEAVNNNRFDLITVEYDRPGPHYTVDTILLLDNQYQPETMYLIIGADSLFDLPTWSRPDQLIQLVNLAVYPRQNSQGDLSGVEQILPGIQDRVTYLTGIPFDVSSSQIRDLVMHRQDIAQYVIPEVAHYIDSHGLYRITDGN